MFLCVNCVSCNLFYLLKFISWSFYSVLSYCVWGILKAFYHTMYAGSCKHILFQDFKPKLFSYFFWKDPQLYNFYIYNSIQVNSDEAMTKVYFLPLWLCSYFQSVCWKTRPFLIGLYLSLCLRILGYGCCCEVFLGNSILLPWL